MNLPPDFLEYLEDTQQAAWNTVTDDLPPLLPKTQQILDYLSHP